MISFIIKVATKVKILTNFPTYPSFIVWIYHIYGILNERTPPYFCLIDNSL